MNPEVHFLALHYLLEFENFDHNAARAHSVRKRHMRQDNLEDTNQHAYLSD